MLWIPACLAQVDVSGQLSGSMTDSTGAVIPNISVTAQNHQTGVETSAITDERGNFLFASLPPGSYTVTCQANGFKKFIANDIVLQSSRISTVRIVLEVGTASQSVEVSSSAAMVNTVTSTVQTTYDQKLLAAIPVLGRDPRQTMEYLMPGATPAGTAVSSSMPVTSFNGVAGTSNNYRIDGSDVNNYFHGAPTAYPPSENIQEFSVTSSVPDASVARGAGGQIEAVMKSGTNNLHGQVWAYFQNSDWNANSWQNNWRGIAKTPFNKRWFGGNAGGPVTIPGLYNGSNRTFFFASYERTSSSQTAPETGRTISNSERDGDFTTSVSGIPVIDGIPTPIIPKSRFSQMGRYLAGHPEVLPAPTTGLDTYSWNGTGTQTVQSFAGKIDHNFSDKHRLFGSLWWSRDTPVCDNMAICIFGNASWSFQYPNSKLQYGYPVKIQSWTLNDTYMITPTILNNFIFGVKRLDISVTNTYDSKNSLFTAADLGVGAVGDVKAPDIQQITFPRSMGMGIYNGYIDDMKQNSYYIVDNVTVIRGRHTWKMGMEVRQYHETKYQTWGAGGNLSFADARQTLGGTGNGMADMLLGVGASFRQNNTQVLDINYPATEAFIQDTIKFSPRLNLMFGARWQPHFGVRSTSDNFVTFRPGQSSTGFPTAPLGLVTVGDQGVPSNLYGTRWGNIGPRASFAWDILGNGRAALRGGYGLATNYQVLIGFNGYTNTAPYGVSYAPPIDTLNLAKPYAASYGSRVPFPFAPPVPGDPANSSLVFPNPVNTLAMDPNYNSAQIHQWNAILDFEPVTSYQFSVGYVATRGTHLSETNEYNFPRFVPGASINTTADINARRPFFTTGFQNISYTRSDWNSMYNSLQITFRKRYTHGLTFMGHYTLSSSAGQNGCRYLADCSLDYYSPGMMHRFATAFSYDLPFRPTSRTGKLVLGGWTVGGVTTASSGGYGSIGDTNCAQFNYGSASCTAAFTGGSPYASDLGQPKLDSKGTQVGLSWLDPSKFLRANQLLVNGVATNSPYTGQRLFLGNAITGVFKGPAAFGLGTSLSKSFAFTERFQANYRLEAFNVLNHTVLNGPSGTAGPDMSQFGIITTAQDPRRLQMSLRFLF
jgi:hypothetical protein